VLLYGHLDKQPPLLPWAEGLHPYKPVIRDGKARLEGEERRGEERRGERRALRV